LEVFAAGVDRKVPAASSSCGYLFDKAGVRRSQAPDRPILDLGLVSSNNFSVILSSSMDEPNTVAAILKALHFASEKHRDQRRKDVESSPYINHPIEVAELLARVGHVTDLAILQGAILHDTIEDTETTLEELEEVFGAEVRRVVEEVTDNKKLQKEARKQLQIDHAYHLSERAKQIKIADKISNVLGVTQKPPADGLWSDGRNT
jgi:(p)ppGpp synthase/HD superfamily hydrolase